MDVTVSNVLPTGVTFGSAVPSQGSCVLNGGQVLCDLGSIASASNAVITITVTGATPNILTNRATALVSPYDRDLSNNFASATGTITDYDGPLPFLLINSAEAVEGDSGLAHMVISMRLATAGRNEVSVYYATASGTATADTDFLPTAGVLVFPPGITNQTFSVPIRGDTVNEPDEFFLINFFNRLTQRSFTQKEAPLSETTTRCREKWIISN
jgi:hypothetical protein